MNVNKRLVQAEKKMSACYADSMLEEDLLKWLEINPYDIRNNFHEWCNKMPKHLVKPFANYLKRHVNFKPLVNGLKDGG